jgi:hypothetical protein
LQVLTGGRFSGGKNKMKDFLERINKEGLYQFIGRG